MIKKILVLGPIWRNQKIVKTLEKKFIVHFTNSKLTKNFIEINKIDMIISSGYPYRVKLDVISSVEIAINLHISYLPFGRGIMPNLWSFIDGYPSGITIHFIDENFDTGKIITQKKVSFNSLKTKTLKTTHDYLLDKLEKFFFQNLSFIINKKFVPYDQNKFYSYNVYRNRDESEKMMKNFKARWNTKISSVIKFAKKNLIKNS